LELIVNKNELNKMLSTAISLAVEAHEGQFDRGGTPYILHALKVMHYTKSEDIEVKCIAVLHDAIEDNKKMTYQRFREAGLSERVLDGIRCMTRVPGETEDEYQNRVTSNKDSILVKMADLRHNSDIRRLKDVREKDFQRMAKYQLFYHKLSKLV
jgi:(p)ppGpp synthase/HD superfamily hydrolase